MQQNAGALIRRSSDGRTNFQSTGVGSSGNDYQGYATTSGRFLTRDRQGTIY